MTAEPPLVEVLRGAAEQVRLKALREDDPQRLEQVCRILSALAAAAGDQAVRLNEPDRWARRVLKPSLKRWFSRLDTRDPFPPQHLAVGQLLRAARLMVASEATTEDVLEFLIADAAQLFPRLLPPATERRRRQARFLRRDAEVLVRAALRAVGMPQARARVVFNYLHARTQRGRNDSEV